MNSREARREKIIEDLKRLIKQRKKMSDETLLLFLMTKNYCSRRTAIEYLKIAKCLK